MPQPGTRGPVARREEHGCVVKGPRAAVPIVGREVYELPPCNAKAAMLRHHPGRLRAGNIDSSSASGAHTSAG